MTLLWFLLGLILPTSIGWLLVRVLEWQTDIVQPLERITLGFVLGFPLMSFVMFLAHIFAGLPLNLVGFLSVQTVLLAILGGIFYAVSRKRSLAVTVASLPVSEPLGTWTKILGLILGVWTLGKIISGAVLLLLNPIYLDDTIDNWNLRAKMFFVDESFALHQEVLGGIASYPPTVPLIKTWFAVLYSEWSEGLVNLIHVVWFVAVLILVFFAIRRHASLLYALIGTYMLANLPLYVIQGTNTYTDVFLSALLLIAVSCAFHAVCASSVQVRSAFLRLSGAAIILSTVVKNEGLALYLPIVLVVVAASMWVLHRKNHISTMQLMQSFGIWFGAGVVLSAPWILYKMQNGLVFGNAQGISNLALKWQPNVLTAITVNTFFEGNWIFLFPLLIGLLIWRWRSAFRSSLAVLTAFLLLAIGAQCFAFLFTSLSTEAIYQTGFARGFTQLMPLLVMLTTLLIAESQTKWSESSHRP